MAQPTYHLVAELEVRSEHSEAEVVEELLAGVDALQIQIGAGIDLRAVTIYPLTPARQFLRCVARDLAAAVTENWEDYRSQRRAASMARTTAYTVPLRSAR